MLFVKNLINAAVSIFVFIIIQPGIFAKTELKFGAGSITSRNVSTTITTLIISIILLGLNKLKGLFNRIIINITLKNYNTFWEKKISINKNEILTKNDKSKFAMIIGLDNYNFISIQFIKFLIMRGYQLHVRTYLSPISDDLLLGIDNYVDCQVHYDSKGFEVEVTKKIERLIANKKKVENIQVITFEIAFNPEYEVFKNYTNSEFKFDIISKKINHGNLEENKFISWVFSILVRIKQDSVEITYNANSN